MDGDAGNETQEIALASPESGALPGAAGSGIRVLVLGSLASCGFIENAVQLAGCDWSVERITDLRRIGSGKVGAMLVPCEAGVDTAIRSLGDLVDAPLILYRVGSTRSESTRSGMRRSIVSLSALSPREVITTIQAAIDRWEDSRAIEARAHALEETRELQIEFLAAVNHEVRTPLNAILGMAEMLLESDLAPDQGRFAQVIHSSGEQLLGVLNQLVDLTRLRAENLRLSMREFGLVDLLQTAADSESEELRERGLGLSIVVDPDLDRCLIGPADRLTEVLRTLVGHAVRNSVHGRIRIGASPDETVVDGPSVRFFIEHVGEKQGSPPLHETFAAFATGTPAISRDHGGVGIGLALAEGLVRAMGGQIWCEEESSRLCFAVPLEAAQPTGGDAFASERLRGVGIALAIDPRTDRNSFRELLEATGAFVRCVDSPRALANAMLEAEVAGLPVDLVVLDESDCSSAILESFQGRTARPPVVVVHAVRRGRHARPALPGVVTLRLDDSVPREEILIALEAVLGVRSSPESALEPVAEPKLRVLVVDDSEDNRTLIATFLRSGPYSLQFAVDGQEAVDAFCAGDFDVVLMDLQMPVMNGYEATQRIRQHEQALGLESTPIVAVTAFAFEEDAERSLASGCDLHLTKPVDKRTLIGLLAKFGSGAASGGG